MNDDPRVRRSWTKAGYVAATASGVLLVALDAAHGLGVARWIEIGLAWAVLTAIVFVIHAVSNTSRDRGEVSRIGSHCAMLALAGASIATAVQFSIGLAF